MKVRIKKVNPNAVIPSYSKEGDAGLDLVATSKSYDEYGNVSYRTGLAIEIPKGYVGLLFPRSSICKYKLSLSNAVGVVDSGYRGEITAKFKTTETNKVVIGGDTDIPSSEYNVGDRVCQLIILPYPHIELEEADELSDSERGEGGFGSSGK